MVLPSALKASRVRYCPSRSSFNCIKEDITDCIKEDITDYMVHRIDICPCFDQEQPAKQRVAAYVLHMTTYKTDM